MKKELNPQERKKIKKIMAGKKDMESEAVQKFLGQEHVAVAFEKILDDAGLSLDIPRDIGAQADGAIVHLAQLLERWICVGPEIPFVHTAL